MAMNLEIHELWRRNPRLTHVRVRPESDDETHRVPKFIRESITETPLVTLGINPSYPAQMPPEVSAIFERIGVDPMAAFDWARSGLANEYDADLVKAHVEAHELRTYKFFEPLDDLARQSGLSSAHFDCFLALASKSKCLPSFYGKRRNYRWPQPFVELPPEHQFVASQLDICYRQLAQAKPKFIVARYAMAADALHAHVESRVPQADVSRWKQVTAIPALKMRVLKTDWQSNVLLFRFSNRCGYKFEGVVAPIVQILHDWTAPR